ncbi:RNA replication protein [Eumeta japonica]|uniref:RNA replication protein n=1 Tax=Eumeta variegata TaxID=151549 RepID=A0A4C1VYA2_EUMVA|nr:RNA replication protein [Eumeta japonica]
MASILLNEFKEQTHSRLLIDEAMMNHFGAIITATLLAKAKELLLIDDINQIPHIYRDNVFSMSYEKPNTVVKVSRELLRSYRNPIDVAYALNEIYSGMYSTKEGTLSFIMDGYDRSKLSISVPQTLYLTHTHAGKTQLKAMGCGQGNESRSAESNLKKCSNSKKSVEESSNLQQHSTRNSNNHASHRKLYLP